MFPEVNLYGEQASLVNADVGVHTCAANRSGLVIAAALCRGQRQTQAASPTIFLQAPDPSGWPPPLRTHLWV